MKKGQLQICSEPLFLHIKFATPGLLVLTKPKIGMRVVDPKIRMRSGISMVRIKPAKHKICMSPVLEMG